MIFLFNPFGILCFLNHRGHREHRDLAFAKLHRDVMAKLNWMQTFLYDWRIKWRCNGGVTDVLDYIKFNPGK